MTSGKKLVLAICAIILNLFLLRYFNTLIWPYLLPRPFLYITIAAVIAGVIYPDLYRQRWLFRVVGILMIFIGQNYWLHSMDVMFTDLTIVSVMHGVGITGVFFVMIVNFINQFGQKNHTVPLPLPDELPYVAAVIPTYGEPVEILENTAKSLLELDYPADHLYIFISDDGHRAEVEAMTRHIGIHYNRGAKKDAKAGNLNSAVAHLGENFPQATLIITQDADEIIDPSFLQKTVGFFNDDKVGFVQTPKEALAPSSDPFGVRDRVFYDVTQPGRNFSGASFSCGSGVVWRIEAIKSIGGYATWNVVEDLTTSYLLHAKGWKSEYFNEILTIGLAPDDIPTLIKQRGTWATDNWRLFLFKNPMIMKGLTLPQRLQYFELGLFYITSSIFLPLLMLVPIISILTGEFLPIEGAALFPWLVISMLYYYVFAQGNVHYWIIMLQYWVSHFWTYIKAFTIAISSYNEKPSYKVTQKTRQSGFYGQLVWAQFAYLIIGFFAIVRGIFFLPDANFVARTTNIGIIVFFMFLTGSICRASFYGYRPSIPTFSILRERLEAAIGIVSPQSEQFTSTEIPLPSGGGD